MRRTVKSVGFGSLLLFGVACQDGLGPPVDDPTPSFSQAVADAPQPSMFADHFIVAFAGSELPSEAVERVRAAGGEIADAMDGISFAAISGITDDVARELLLVGGVSGVSRDVNVQWIPEFTGADVRQQGDAGAQAHDPTDASFFLSDQWDMRQIDVGIVACPNPGHHV